MIGRTGKLVCLALEQETRGGLFVAQNGCPSSNQNMKIDLSWESNKQSLIVVVSGLVILAAVNVFNLGIVEGALVGGLVGGGMVFLFNRKKERKEVFGENGER